jgi:hypothetical protein
MRDRRVFQCALIVGFTLCIGADALAQLKPQLSAELGVQYLRKSTPTMYSGVVPSGAWLAPVLGGSVGVMMFGWIMPELRAQSTLGPDAALRTLSAGITIKPTRGHGAYVHLAVANLQATLAACPDGQISTDGVCDARVRPKDARTGVDARAGFAFARRANVQIGAEAWWTESLSERDFMYQYRYRALGIGLRATAF